MPTQTTSIVSPKEVVAYKQDVWTWVYFDQIDHVLRYEAYVISYQDSGEPGCLRLVLEEGLILDPQTLKTNAPLLAARLLMNVSASSEDVGERQFPLWPHIEISKTSLYLAGSENLYHHLDEDEVKTLHQQFHSLEEELKQQNRKRWKNRLKLLGYDVIDSAY